MITISNLQQMRESPNPPFHSIYTLAESQRKKTLKDGQQAGEMVLYLEAQLGELAEKEERATPLVGDYKEGHLRGSKPSGKPPKHERLGISEQRMHQAQAISKHPEIVEKVKAQARENEDIPTRTAGDFGDSYLFPDILLPPKI